MIAPSPFPSPPGERVGVRGFNLKSNPNLEIFEIKGGRKYMAYESQKVALKYFVISAIFFGLQVVVGLLLVSKYYLARSL